MGVAVIHVVDDQAHASKEFRCDIKMLLAHMKLLAADLDDVPGQDIEITVNCDISTFAWLMAYVKAGGRGQQPQTTLDNCLRLLLASHYLQMSPVLKHSAAYIATNLLALAPSAAAQLCSLDSCLLDKLAKAVQEETLEALHQTHHQQQQPQQLIGDSPAHSHPKHSHSSTSSSGGSSSSARTLVNKLYKHKLCMLLQQQNSTVLRCKACGQLFASSSRHKLLCAAGQAAQDRQYKLPLHAPDQAWDLQTFLAQQRTAANVQQKRTSDYHQQQQPHGAQQEQELYRQPLEQQQKQEPSSWRELYWLVWGLVVVLYCQRCCSHFPARLLHQCSYHPLPAVFTSDEVIGRYPCCGAPAWQPGGSAVVAAAAASLQPCCSRDHDVYISASSGWQGRQQPGAVGKGSKGAKGAPVDSRRAVQLLRLFGPVITAAAPASIQQQQQLQQQQALVPVAAGQYPAMQKHQGPVLPLLVKLVKRGASAAVAAAAAGSLDGLSAAAASGSGGGSKAPGSQPASRPSSVSPLPFISPRQWSAGQQQQGTLPTSSSSSAQLQQGQSYSVPAAAASAIAAAAAASGPGRVPLYSATLGSGHAVDTDDFSRSSSDGGSSSSDSAGSSRSSGSSNGSDEQVEYLDSDDRADGDDEFSLARAHATPLSSIMGAVRAAAEARTKGVGLSSGTAGSRAGRLHQMGAPLAETFSAGGRRVLVTAGCRPLHSSNLLDPDSRSSTAASLLSLNGQHQLFGGQSPSRPGTSSSVGRMGGEPAAAAAAGGGAGRVESSMGGLSAVGVAFNRTLLLELVQQDDAYRMGVLMRKLDSLRLQAPLECAEHQQVQQGLIGQPQQLTQVDVMKAVNGVLFQGKYV